MEHLFEVQALSPERLLAVEMRGQLFDAWVEALTGGEEGFEFSAARLDLASGDYLCDSIEQKLRPETSRGQILVGMQRQVLHQIIEIDQSLVPVRAVYFSGIDQSRHVEDCICDSGVSFQISELVDNSAEWHFGAISGQGCLDQCHGSLPLDEAGQRHSRD